jgi:hypothetical protein
MTDLSTWDLQPPVKVGTHVVLELIDEHGGREPLELDVVADAAADFDAGRLGIGTPLGKAIAGKRAGSVAPYKMGDLREVLICDVRPAAGGLAAATAEDAAERRQATLDKAAQEIAKTNAQIFASTFEGKWGGYNPEGMDHWDDGEEGDERARGLSA